jgi:sulfate transport system permease protein
VRRAGTRFQPAVLFSNSKANLMLPGFRLTLGLTMAWIGLLVLLPLSAVVLRAIGIGWSEFWGLLSRPYVLSAFKVSYLTSLYAALVNVVLGVLVAWVLVRYRFPGRRLFDGLVDLPFALPTAVAGITLTTLFSANGWLGKWFYQIGIETAYSKTGITIALIFIGLPFVVRTVQPILEDLDPQLDEAAASLGADRLTTFRRVLFPELRPAILTGFGLAFARGLGEYGSVLFISGNKPFETVIVPLLIVEQLEDFRYEEACVLGTAMLFSSFATLLLINAVQRHYSRHLKP